MPSDEFHRVRRLEAYDVAPDWAVHHIPQHEAEHWSQIAWLRDTYPSGSSSPTAVLDEPR